MEFFKELVMGYGVGETGSAYLATAIVITLLILFCVLANFVTKKIILRLITHVIQRNNLRWGSALLKHKVFHKLSHIVPAIMIYNFTSAFSPYEAWVERLPFCISLVSSSYP